MAFTITADLPLGVYRGRHSDGSSDRIPSLSRLHSALLSAAGFGPRAQSRNGGLAPHADDAAALHWLETNPPDTVAIPSMSVNIGAATAYRDDGTINRNKNSAQIRKLPKSANTSVAIDGPFRWTWHTPPPKHVRTALVALCPDVPYLGTTESPVRIRAEDTDSKPTHRHDPHADAFDQIGETLDLPAEGRTDELIDAHTEHYSRTPSVAKDRATGNERVQPPPIPRTRIRQARYVPIDTEGPSTPWAKIWVLPLGKEVARENKVRCAVAAHRALIALIGDGAPPLITGSYPTGAKRPANRVALHILNPEHRPGGGHDTSALAILIPADAPRPEVSVLRKAMDNLRILRWARDSTTVGKVEGPVPGWEFWPPPAKGLLRCWQTDPPAIPDTRPVDPQWTFSDAALLSISYVWQEYLDNPARGASGKDRYRRYAQAAVDANVQVLRNLPLHANNAMDFVHRAHADVGVIRPYETTLYTGRLGTDRTIQAIGQSRHLGGGLLVPYDIPMDLAQDFL